MRPAQAIMAELAASGLTAPQLALVMELSAAVATEARPIEDKAAQRRRERDRKYQAEKRQNRQTSADSDDPSPNEDILTPTQDSPKPNGFAPAKKSKREKGTRLPNDWALPDEWRQWAKERRHWSERDIDEETELFANYWQAKSGAGACHTDWFKTWRNWCIRSHRKDGERAGKPLTPEEAKASAAKTAEFYEKIGRSDDAADLRRRYALPVSSALPSNVTNLLRQGAA